MPRYRQIDQTNLMLQIDLTNQLLPDHSTIADFISRHAENDALVDEDTIKGVDHLNETIQRIGEFLDTHSPRMGSSVRSGEVKSNITEAQTASSRVTTVWRRSTASIR